MLSDAMLDAANWVIELDKIHLDKAADIKFTVENITYFQERMGKSFVIELKSNILNMFASQNVSSVSIFDQVLSEGFFFLDSLLMGRTQLTH